MMFLSANVMALIITLIHTMVGFVAWAITDITLNAVCTVKLLTSWFMCEYSHNGFIPTGNGFLVCLYVFNKLPYWIRFSVVLRYCEDLIILRFA